MRNGLLRAAVLLLLGASIASSAAHAQGAPSCALSPQVTALLRSLEVDARYGGASSPLRMPAALACEVAREAASPAVAAALAGLDARRTSTEWRASLAALRRERAAFSLAAALWHADVDGRIDAARAVAALAERRTGLYVAAYARSILHFVSGSEEATLHGMLQHAVAEALAATSGARASLQQPQDIPGLARVIAEASTRLGEPTAVLVLAASGAGCAGRSGEVQVDGVVVGTYPNDALLVRAGAHRVTLASAGDRCGAGHLDVTLPPGQEVRLDAARFRR